MKAIISIIIICIFTIGCGEKAYKPVIITINKDGTFLVDSKPKNIPHLKKYLIDIMAEKGNDLKVLFVADEEILFTVVEPVILASAETNAYLLNFKILGSQKIERCEINGGCRPPTTELSAEIKDNVIYIDNIKKSISEVKELFTSKPNKASYYLVFISCSGKTTFGTFYRFIELCNQSEYACVVLNLINGEIE